MEKTEPQVKVKKKQGGARPGAGRPKGSKNQLTIADLLTQIHAQSGQRDYEEILVEDFMKARANNDSQLMLKYHNLILNKVMNSLTKIELNEGQDAIEAKKQAFAEALAKLTGVKKD